jgi:hypothetical protein
LKNFARHGHQHVSVISKEVCKVGFLIALSVIVVVLCSIAIDPRFTMSFFRTTQFLAYGYMRFGKAGYEGIADITPLDKFDMSGKVGSSLFDLACFVYCLHLGCHGNRG